MRTRLVVVFLVPVIAILLSLAAATGWSAARSIQQVMYTEQLGDLGYFVGSARQALRSGSEAVVDGEARRFQEVHDIEVIVFDLAGAVWATSDPGRPVLTDAEAERVRLALSGRRAEAPDPPLPWVLPDATAVEPVFDDGDVIGAVMITADVEAPRAELLRQVLLLVAVAIVSIVLGVVLVFQLARWVLSPVRRLDEAMVAIERGQMHARVAEDTGPPELRRMTRVFNGMAEEIERVLARQQEFATNASHELRNPLNALLLRVEHLATGLGPEWQGDVEETREEGRRMARILETLLGLARRGRADSVVSPVDLAELTARRVEAWSDVAAQRGIHFTREGDAGVVSTTDRTIIEAALDAVIDNAVKFSPDGGVIDVAARRAPIANTITVRDHGPGLPQDEVGSATDRFWRSADSGDVPGTGLGLAIATDLLASVDSELTVASLPDGGLQITLHIADGETA